MALTMQDYFNDVTNVATFSLQSNDWFILAMLMKNNLDRMDDLATQLKVLQRVQNPPNGNTLMAAINTYLGVYLNLYYMVETSFGKEVGKSARNRFKTALEAIAATYPTITTFLADLAALEIADENAMVTAGRKWLRGKTEA